VKDKTTAGILALVCGGVGIHRFYLGQPILGILYILFCWTFIPAIIALAEGLYLLLMPDQAFHIRYNQGFELAHPGVLPPNSSQNIVVNVTGADQNTGTSPPAAAAPVQDDMVRKIKDLYELKQMGALTEEEFQLQKAKLLN